MVLARVAPKRPCIRRARLTKRGRAAFTVLLAAITACFCWASVCFTTAGRVGHSSHHDFHLRILASRSAAGVASKSHIPRPSRGGQAADVLEVGDKVQAVCPDDEQRYPGIIEKVNRDGTFTVKWDDPGDGSETHDVAADAIKKVIIFKDYAVGDDVKAISPDDGRWYPGTIAKTNDDGTFQVKWDNPDGGPGEHDIKPEDMKKVNVFKGYKVNDVVEGVFPDDGQMYPGTVVKVNKDGTFQVKWDDAGDGPESSPCSPKQMRYPRIPFNKLAVGQKYSGTVKQIREFGAFVDIGAEGDGLLHISRISKQKVDDVNDFLEEGQEVDVWISGVRDDGKFGLTLVEGKVEGGGGGPRAPADLSKFADLSPDQWQTGTVARIAPFGAFVSVSLPDGGPTADGLVHISQIKDGFVSNVEEFLEVGQEVQVRVQSVDLVAGKMSLSMKAAGSGGGGGGGGPRAPSDLSAFQSIASDQWLSGKVARTASFGAFVTVTSPDGKASADGLVHITQIKDGFVQSVEDELTIGQEVQVRIQSVDVGAGKLSLSMKPGDS